MAEIYTTYARQCGAMLPHPSHTWGYDLDEQPSWYCVGLMDTESLPKSLRWTQNSLVGLFRTHQQLHNPHARISNCSCGRWEGPYTHLGRQDNRAFEFHLAVLVLAGPLLCTDCGTAMVELTLGDFICEHCGSTATGS